MATLNSQRIIEAGKIPALTTLDASNNFLNTGSQFIYYSNRSGGSQTITITAVVTSIKSPLYGDIVKNDAVIVVPNGSIGMIGPFPVEAYNDVDGLTAFAITPSSGTDEAAILFL
tara:strand:- start:15947 stop:16291 length:345 start_codon:yes stop_codon:yes gene_type:complete